MLEKKTGNILVTAIGSASADIVIKSFHAMQCRVIGTDIYPREWIANSLMVDVFVQIPLAANHDKYVDMLLEICQKENVLYIVPLTDTEIDVLNERREEFENQNIKLCISDRQAIRMCRDKRRTAEIIKDSKVCRVIPEIDDKLLAEYNNFPVVCKKVNGRSSSGMQIFYLKDELQGFIRNHNKKDWVIQPFIEGTIITADILRDSRSNDCIVVAREELLRTSNGMGLTVHVFYDEALYNTCTKIADILNVCGCVNFEFIKTSEKDLYFLECNPRFSGGVKFSVMAGYNFPQNHLNYFQNEKIDLNIIPKEQIMARKYEEYIMLP